MDTTRLVGYQFRPTDEEIVDHYLLQKMSGNHSLVDNCVNEVDFYGHDPWELCSLSKLDSSLDFTLYFFYHVRNTRTQRRMTKSGKWKKTGQNLVIRRRRGNEEIGEKKFFVFINKTAPKEKTSWVMHEYHSWAFPEAQRSYVLCKLECKADRLDDVVVMEPSAELHRYGVSYSNTVGLPSSTLGHELAFSVEQIPPGFDDFSRYVDNMPDAEWDSIVGALRSSYMGFQVNPETDQPPGEFSDHFLCGQSLRQISPSPSRVDEELTPLLEDLSAALLPLSLEEADHDSGDVEDEEARHQRSEMWVRRRLRTLPRTLPRSTRTESAQSHKF